MSALEQIRDALAGPDGNLSRSNWDDRVRITAIQFPSLAAALAELLDEQGWPIPGPLRHARNNIRQEKLF
jgi:hypothetical protein